MTEAEWLACTAPEPMLEFLYSKERNERKLRLFVCACCRRMWDLLDVRSRAFVAVSERYFDGLIDTRDRVRVARLHNAIFQDSNLRRPTRLAADIVNRLTPQPGTAWALAWNAVSGVRSVLQVHSPRFDHSAECKAQAALLREIFGNPFSRAHIDRATFRWQDSVIPKLAQGLSDRVDFNCLPILADALEEAGCTNFDILNHCRQPGEHVRGCWVIDLILGKE